MRPLILIAFLTVSLGLACAAATAETISGHVVRVLDGDTVSVLTPEKQEVRVRLAEIDAPEKNQPFGMNSKKMLSDLIFGKDVSVVKIDTDFHGRTVGRIYQGQTDVSLEMVKAGGAWAYTKYLTDSAIRAAEVEARTGKRGLWALQEDQRIPPWEWRKEERAGTPSPSDERSAASPESDPGTFACAGKTRCKQMTSCAEAEFYLHTCGLSRLDGDHDGIPCESLCR